MNLEEIISAAVEKRVRVLVETAFIRPQENDGWGNPAPAQVEEIVARAVQKIAEEEVAKHSDTIRMAVIESLRDGHVRFEINTYAKAVIQKEA